MKNRGIAILMIMSSIAILAFLLADFTYETKLNKLKVYNQQDKLQARLNAEAGLKFALAKLRIYVEARNLWEKDVNGVKGFISVDKIEALAIDPFLYPIADGLLSQANIIQRNAINEFQKSVVLKGKLSVNIKPISGLINVNALRAPDMNDNATPTPDPNDQGKSGDQSGGADSSGGDSHGQDDKHKKTVDAFIENELLKSLEVKLTEKREQDEYFESLYGDVDANLLVKELKYFVNAENKFDDPEKGEIENKYQSQNIFVKHAPMTSLSELHLLIGWKDDIIELIEDQLSVHSVSIIPINKITANQLKLLFPALNAEQIKDFFEYRDGSKENKTAPKKMKSVEDFKEALVDKLQAVEGNTFDARIKEFASYGIRFGAAGKLFKIQSIGEYGRSTYTLEAYVDLPIKPNPKKKTPKKADPNDPNSPPNPDQPAQPDQPADGGGQSDDKSKDKKEDPIQLFPPRVIELQIL